MLKRLFASRNNPCFSSTNRWDTLVYDLSGNRLEITLPPQDYEFPEEDNGKRFNLFDPSFYEYQTEPDRNGYPAHNKGVSRDSIWRRNWYTYGSILQSQHIGTLQSAAVICDISRMTPTLNCFNPEQLERLIIHGIYYGDGPGFGTNEYHSPVNWQLKQLHGVEWIYFESWEYQPAWLKEPHPFTFGCHFTAWLMTPLYADKYLLLPFVATGTLPAEPSNSVMMQRITEIIPTIKLTLSPEAQKQRESTRLQNPDIHYSQSRHPEAWKYYGSFREGDPIKGEKNIVFEGKCSPPPQLY